MSILFDKAFAVARNVKAFLNLRGDSTRGAASDAGRGVSEQRERIQGEIRSKKREISRLKNEIHAAKGRAQVSEQRKRFIKEKQELSRLKAEFRAAKKQQAKDASGGWLAPPRAASGLETGALPDFVIIGAQKCGTTSLYQLLIRHPYVEPAASKELHFFDNLFEEGVEWYRHCFPQPKWKDGRRTITGEATPAYLFRPQVPERMAEVVPQARLIALLRNPVDRVYSHYHQKTRKGHETRSFEEAIEADMTWLLGSSEHEHGADVDHALGEYLPRGIYIDQLLRWSRFFSDEQMLVLKSEDLFERPRDILKIVLNFLALPDWEPDTLKPRRKKHSYGPMDPATRRRLEDFFEPHNQRLYEHLGVDFGW